MTDIIFLKALRDKLKGGNTRSIHLNVLPGRFATRLDLANLNYIRPEFAEKFLELLLTNSCFDFKISFDGIDLSIIQSDEQKRLGLLSKRLNSLNIENDDNYKEHGIKTFGFGFPILVMPSTKDPKKIIKAPLFIWQLEIIKSTNKVNTWSILRNKVRNENGKIIDEEVHSVGLNEVLLSFLKTENDILVPQINEDLLEDAVIDRNELIDECCKVLEKLNVVADQISLTEKLNQPINNIPESSSLESISSNKPWIHFGGVFGLFRTQKESIITDIDKIIDRVDDFYFENLEVENFSGTTHSAVEADPSQQEILNTLGIEPKKIIQGPPGTGKSQSLTAIITNALANNLKCLVVCEKKTALDVIKNNLHKENDQLGALAAVVEDINKDRDGIVNSVRDRLSNLSQFGSYPQTFYNNNLETVEAKAKEINLQHQELDKNFYKGKTWTQLVGEFLKTQRLADFSGLKSKLDYKEFKFQKDENELSEILGKINVAKNLYHEINRLDHPLEMLHDEIFRQDIPRAIQLRLEKTGKETSAKLEGLKTRLQKDVSDYEKWLDDFYKSGVEKTEKIADLFCADINEYQSWLTDFYKLAIERVKQLTDLFDVDINEYQNWLNNHYETYYHELKLKIKGYQDFGSENYERFGELFYKNDGLTKLRINILSILSKKHLELKNNRLLLIDKISEIKEAHLSLKYFEHNYLEEAQYKTLKVYVDNINDISISADDWYSNSNPIKEDYVKKLSSDFLHPQYKKNKQKIIETENTFQEFIFYTGKDNNLITTIKSTETHFSKIEELRLLSLQLESIEKFKEDYVDKLSSAFLHPHYKVNIQKVVDTENIFQEFISYIQKDKRLTTPINDIAGHSSKIQELQLLMLQLKEYEKIKNYYVKNLSSKEIHAHYKSNANTLQSTENQFEETISILNSEQILKRNLPFSENHCQKISESIVLISEMLKLAQNLEDFREYFEWRKFYIDLSPLHHIVLKSLIETESKDWGISFENWYYYWLLAIIESDLKYLPKDNTDIFEFKEAKKELKTNQVRSIISNWANKQKQAIKNSQNKGINTTNLFNKRGSRGERRNSLRKIIKTDFELFTDFFPVVMVSPTVCSSIIPLEEAIFDIVIFDEASQLRLEDTFPALLRGKIKVVSGDSQQMPPSNFFQGGTALLLSRVPPGTRPCQPRARRRNSWTVRRWPARANGSAWRALRCLGLAAAAHPAEHEFEPAEQAAGHEQGHQDQQHAHHGRAQFAREAEQLRQVDEEHRAEQRTGQRADAADDDHHHHVDRGEDGELVRRQHREERPHQQATEPGDEGADAQCDDLVPHQRNPDKLGQQLVLPHGDEHPAGPRPHQPREHERGDRQRAQHQVVETKLRIECQAEHRLGRRDLAQTQRAIRHVLPVRQHQAHDFTKGEHDQHEERPAQAHGDHSDQRGTGHDRGQRDWRRRPEAEPQFLAQQGRHVGANRHKRGLPEIDFANIAQQQAHAECQDAPQQHQAEQIDMVLTQERRQQRQSRQHRQRQRGGQRHAVLPPNSPAGRNSKTAIMMRKVKTSLNA